MDRVLMVDVIESMYAAGRISSIVPKLPPHVKRGQAAVLHSIEKLAGRNGRVRVTDISAHKRVTSPGTIRLIKSCEESGFVRKIRDCEDRRVVYLELTDAGKEVLEKTFDPFMERLAAKCTEHHSDEKWLEMSAMIYELYDIINEASNEMDNQLK